jgi:iron complex transport system ATP-binding protein
MSATVLRATGLWAAYPGSPTPVLHELCLELDKGEVLALLGPNGAGKSSLVRALTGLLAPSRGSVELFGRDLRSLARREIARRVAVVPQSPRVAFGFSVREAVLMGRAPHQGAMLVASETDRRVVDGVLERTGLGPLASRPAAELSGGEQLLVAIARALAQQPEILMLDEATAHLDVRHSVLLHALVRTEVRERGLACLAVLHDLNEAAQNADRVVLLGGGTVRAQGTIEQVMTYRTLRETFGVDLYVGVNELDGTRYFVPIRQGG